MHLIVDHAGQQPRAVQGDLAAPGQARADALNAAVGNAHIAFERAAFVDDGGVFQHPIHMCHPLVPRALLGRELKELNVALRRLPTPKQPDVC